MKTQKKRLYLTTSLGTAVIAAVVIFTGYALWFAYHSSHLANASLQSANQVSSEVPKLPDITSFATCKTAPGSHLMMTNPEQCVAATGKKYTSNTKYLIITQWNIEVPLTTPVENANYTIAAGNSNEAYLSLTKTHTTACHAGSDSIGSYVRFMTGEIDTRTGASLLSEHPQAVNVGSYYYYYTPPQSICTSGVTSLQSQSIYAAFRQAIQRAKAD